MLGGPEIVSLYIMTRNVRKESWLTHETAKCHPMSKRNLGSFLCQTADVHSMNAYDASFSGFQ